MSSLTFSVGDNIENRFLLLYCFLPHTLRQGYWWVAADIEKITNKRFILDRMLCAVLWCAVHPENKFMHRSHFLAKPSNCKEVLPPWQKSIDGFSKKKPYCPIGKESDRTDWPEIIWICPWDVGAARVSPGLSAVANLPTSEEVQFENSLFIRSPFLFSNWNTRLSLLRGRGRFLSLLRGRRRFGKTPHFLLDFFFKPSLREALL